MQAIIEQVHNAPSISSEAEATGFDYFAPLFKHNERAVRDGAVKDQSMQLTIAFIFYAIISLARSHVSQEMQADDALLE